MPNENSGVVDTQPVVAKTDGERNTAQNDTPTERTYTESDIQKMIDNRFKKHSAVVADLQQKLAEAEEKSSNKKSTNVEEDLRSKLTKYETELKARDAKIGDYRQKQLSAELYRTLDTGGCVDPEVAIDYFVNRKLVHLDDSGEIVVENVSGKLSDLVTDFLEKRPHLRKAQQVNGVGSKPTKASATATTPNNQRLAEAAAQLGIDLTKMNPSRR